MNIPTASTMDSPLYIVQGVRWLTDATFVLRIARRGLPFRAGQCLSVGPWRGGVNREYSLYSGENEPYLEFLIRLIPAGAVTPVLARLRAGEPVYVAGPYSDFVLPPAACSSGAKLVLIATGTGIAPFHAFVRTYPNLDYLILHGIRHAREAYDRTHYAPDRYVSCVSEGDGGDFRGRVTDYLATHSLPPASRVYLCGNRSMIEDVYQLLRQQGISSDRIASEVFF